MSNRKTQLTSKIANLPASDAPLGAPGAGLGGELKREEEDFRVEELRPDPLTGQGEHWVVKVEKRGLTTDQVARWLAEACGVRRREVGYAGLKDRHGVAVQDFSISPGPGKPLPDLESLRPPGVTLLAVGRHQRKIRPGHLSGNRFQIRLRRELLPLREEEEARRRADATACWIAEHGVPNYFDEQRFGFDAGNIEHGLALLAMGRQEGRRKSDPFQRGLYLSALRSSLFNHLLARRIEVGWFTRLLPGDVAMLAGRTGCFPVVDIEVEQARFERLEIHATGRLPGQGGLRAEGEPGELERAVEEGAAEVVAGLEAFGLEGERRTFRVLPRDWRMQWEADGNLLLTFSLPRGCYATMVMRCFMEE
ncbi:MAG: tRNA pseudouridine(13) synthase TruD [Magnetococcales bacterium]|nr:tRNA pseudouridine(13) synthase TruD [Magnetococcales bacterium]